MVSEVQANPDYIVIRNENEQDVLRVDNEGNVLIWKEQEFIELCENNPTEAIFAALLTVYKLGKKST